MKFDPPMLTEGPLTGCIYVVTHGKVLENGIVESSRKYDVTDQFEALAVKRYGHGRRITHGRHCTCSACAREDWTSPEWAPCGMHGKDCPAAYQPLGLAGTDAPLRGQSND